MKTIRLLTIGNSFAGNALTYLEPIAEATGAVHFDIGRANLGGCSLEKHWNLATYTAREPGFKTYCVGVDGDGEPLEMGLQNVLAAKPWDVVTLQQTSRKSWLRESFEPWLGQLHGMVRTRAPRADIMLHQTWAYRSDTPYYPENGMTQELMHSRIRDCYRHFAAKYDCRVLASGEALHRARQAPGRTFCRPDPDYDYQRGGAPGLPRQEHSFAVGWNWQITGPEDGIPVLCLDANHLNARGCYLCSCVWFETLTGLSTLESSFCPDELDPEDAAFLRDVAHATCHE